MATTENRVRPITIAEGVLAAVAVGWVLHLSSPILQPLVIAVLLANILQPVVRVLAKIYIPPAVTVLALLIGLFFGFARLGLYVQTSVVAFVGPVDTLQVDPWPTSRRELDLEDAFDEAGAVARVVDEGALGGLLDNQAELAEEVGGWSGIVDRIGERMRDSALPDAGVELILAALKDLDVRGAATGLIGSGLGFTRGLLLVMIYMIFLFAEQAVFQRKILAVAGEARDDAAEMLETLGRRLQRYLGVKTTISVLTGVLAFLVLVGLEIPYALLFGLLTFALNFIPTFGSIIAAVFPTVTALAVEPTWSKAVIVLGAYLAINFVLGNIIEPKILGRELNLSPLVIVISVLVWGSLWGVPGAFLAVPMTTALQIVLANQDRTRPIALLLSSGLPEEGKQLRLPVPKARRRRAQKEA